MREIQNLMKLSHGLHLAYCTNIHRGETWPEIFQALQTHTLAVRERVCPDKPYAIGLRLGAQAVHDLSNPSTLLDFHHWLDRNQCYVFTVNGFPYGQFHGTRVKEQVYTPDWATPERLDYTLQLFDILAQLVPDGIEGSVSTVPVSFKAFMGDPARLKGAQANLWKCVDQLHRICRRYGRNLHLGLEPEPLCHLETTTETVEFFEQMRRLRPGDTRLEELVGINYDCCHLAIEFEEPAAALARLKQHSVRISKIHISNALRVTPTPEVAATLQHFQDPVYLHQVIARDAEGKITRHQDLDVALASLSQLPPGAPLPEWRIHFHIPLHCPPDALYQTTADHVQGVMDQLAASPGLCSHMEMETYTWEVMPTAMKNRSVVEQLVAEYEWTLAELGRRRIRPL
jgi:hypothetical protein